MSTNSESELNKKPTTIEIPSSYKLYQIDFGNHLRCKIKVTDNKIEVEAAMNGWGDSVSLDEVVIVEV